MERASSEIIVMDTERGFEPAISRPQLSALPAELRLYEKGSLHPPRRKASPSLPQGQ